MSELAVIRVIKCDGCKMITTLMTEEQYKNYDQNWFSDINQDLCPVCLDLQKGFNVLTDPEIELEKIFSTAGV